MALVAQVSSLLHSYESMIPMPGFKLTINFWSQEILTCQDMQCGPNAECVQIDSGEPECRCLAGFYGDGLYCYQHTGVDIVYETGKFKTVFDE